MAAFSLGLLFTFGAAAAMLFSPPAALGITTCAGDCDQDGQVVVNELVKSVNIALGVTDVSECPAADNNADSTVTVNELVTSVNNALEGCPVDEGLGTRRFSLNPATSGFSIEGLPFELSGTGFTGYVDLKAGNPDPETGLAEVSMTDASDYISMLLQPFGGPSMVICVRPLRELLPVKAGILACNGGQDFGLIITQDHNIGVVGESGFSEEDCLAAGGTVESADGPHPGVCNGPVLAEESGSDSGPGALAIAPDPDTFEGGFPAMLGVEEALPCGDESVEETSAPLAFTSGLSRAVILDKGNVADQTLELERVGENFSCSDWTSEDGPGTLVLVAPIIDEDTGVLGYYDLANVFVFDD